MVKHGPVKAALQPEPIAAEAMLLRSLTWPVPVMTNAYRLSANAYVKQADSDKAIERLQTAVTNHLFHPQI